jgi:hypothetical protein
MHDRTRAAVGSERAITPHMIMPPMLWPNM